MTNWQTTKASDFCLSVRDGTHDSPKRVNNGKYLITSRHIIGSKIDLTNAYQISNSDYDEVNRRSKVDRWDVLLTMIGTVGEVCLVKDEPNFAIKNIGLFKSKNELFGKWLYYFLQSKKVKQVLDSLKRGTTQEYIPLGELRNLNISYPTNILEIQNIISILSALDDKIENNHKINETLEEMSCAIFKSWFVDFDPVHAKAAGITPAYMDTETVNLFPSSFSDDGLPVGWNLLSLGEVTEKITKGTTPSKKDLNEAKTELNTINFLKVNNISDDGYFNKKSFEKIPLSIHNNQLKRSILEKDDVLYSIAGTIGRVIIIENSVLPSNTNQALAILRPKKKLCPAGYLSLILKDDYFKKELHSNIVQGVQANLGLTIISAQKFAFPPAEKIDKIFSSINNLLEMQKNNNSENQTLAELRDTLLPKLMSGEIRVKDAEREVEAAV
jgi:type I restriction enzyme, S subunit